GRVHHGGPDRSRRGAAALARLPPRRTGAVLVAPAAGPLRPPPVPRRDPDRAAGEHRAGQRDRRTRSPTPGRRPLPPDGRARIERPGDRDPGSALPGGGSAPTRPVAQRSSGARGGSGSGGAVGGGTLAGSDPVWQISAKRRPLGRIRRSRSMRPNFAA